MLRTHLIHSGDLLKEFDMMKAGFFFFTYILYHILFHYGLSVSQDIEYSSLCYVRPCCFSILYVITCIC